MLNRLMFQASRKLEMPKNRLLPYLLVCTSFILLNTYAIINGSYWVSYLPVLVAIFLMVFFELERALLLLTFLIPLSINFDDVGYGLGISLPDEPFIILIMFLSVFKIFIKSEYHLDVFRHPITVALLINFGWMLFTAFTSDMPFVSLKFMLSRFWYIVVFYFMAVMLFIKRENISKYLWLYIASLSLVIIYALIRHGAAGFTRETSYTLMQPFYAAHGIYAAAIAFFIPFLVISCVFYNRFLSHGISRILVLLVLGLFAAGLVFSFTRAAWLSVMGLAFILVPLMLRVRLRTLVLLVGTGLLLFVVFQNQVYYVLSKTQDVSSSDLSVHLKSVANVKSDASNAERINRWMSAIGMFKERPITGFGPGTYMFCYAPFQQSNYTTIISTNFGDVGNAHSEYLGPLAESGVMGLLTLLILIYVVLQTAFRLFYDGRTAYVRYMALSVMLGLITYLIHGVMNNYIESDKIAVLWWGGMAVITALDLYHNHSKNQA
ncbi:MAG: O-antigen ligase family protein [Bacteroidota bacterium]